MSFHHKHPHIPHQPNPQLKRQQDLQTLKQQFPTMDTSAAAEIYDALNGDLNQTRDSIRTMLAEDQKNSFKQTKVSPKTATDFMKMIFSKIDPLFLEDILQRYGYVVENALDELLEVERQRSEFEEQELRKAEEARRRRAELERQEFLRQQQEIEQKNVITQFQIQFPRLNPAFVVEVLQKNGFNQQVCWGILNPLEVAKAQEEEYYRQQQYQQQMLAEQQRQIQAAQQQMQQMQAITVETHVVESVLHNAKNWDDVIQNFDQKLGLQPLAGQDGNAGADAAEQQYVINLIHEMFVTVEEKEIRQICAQNQWQLPAIIPAIETIAYQQFRTNLFKQFPELSQGEIEPVIQQCFPDASLAAKELGMLGQQGDLVKSLASQVAALKKRLDEALERQAEANQQFEKQKIERQSLFNKFSREDQLQFKGTFDMVQQQEADKFKETATKHADEVQKLKDELAAVERKLNEAHAVKSAPKKNHFQKSTKERIAEIEQKIYDHKAEMEKSQAKYREQKKTLIGEKMRNALGGEKFNALLEAIDRAPGGRDKEVVEYQMGKLKHQATSIPSTGYPPQPNNNNNSNANLPPPLAFNNSNANSNLPPPISYPPNNSNISNASLPPPQGYPPSNNGSQLSPTLPQGYPPNHPQLSPSNPTSPSQYSSSGPLSPNPTGYPPSFPPNATNPTEGGSRPPPRPNQPPRPSSSTTISNSNAAPSGYPPSNTNLPPSGSSTNLLGNLPQGYPPNYQPHTNPTSPSIPPTTSQPNLSYNPNPNQPPSSNLGYPPNSQPTNPSGYPPNMNPQPYPNAYPPITNNPNQPPSNLGYPPNTAPTNPGYPPTANQPVIPQGYPSQPVNPQFASSSAGFNDLARQYFQEATRTSAKPGYLTAAECQFFRRFGLQDTQLVTVWAIASQGQPDLTYQQFEIALNIIALFQQGYQTVTPELLQAAKQNQMPLIPRLMNQ